jgi:hypothetical protein
MQKLKNHSSEVNIQNIRDSDKKANLYILYDRHFALRGYQKYLWMGWQLPPDRTGPVYFYSELEARAWLTDTATGRAWNSSNSLLYVIELPDIMSTEVLLSNDKRKRLDELVTEELVEQLWQEQYHKGV